MKIDPNCKACGGSGANSKGSICLPCQRNGEVVLGRDRAGGLVAGPGGMSRGEQWAGSGDPIEDDPALEGF